MKGLILVLCLILVLITEDVNSQPGIPLPTEMPTKAPIVINKEQMGAVVKEFGDNMERMVKNFTAYKYFNENYMKFTDKKELDGRSLVNEIARDINAMLKRKIEAVKELVRVAEVANNRSVYEPTIDYDYLNNKKLLSDDDLVAMNTTVEKAKETYNYLHLTKDHTFNGEMVNFDLSTVHVPTNVFDKAPVIQNGVKWSDALDNQFKKNHKSDQSLKWQYFCSSDGFFRVYPGMKWPKNNTEGRIDTFDCRIRSWYIKAATSPKNIIILVDKSGSMKGLRMKITHSTVNKILQTLSDEDHFNIIKFSDEPFFVDENCTNNSLIHASESNKRRMLDKVKAIEPEKKANFSKAFIAAFELFESEEAYLANLSMQLNQLNENKQTQEDSKLCNKAIMLITDGTPEMYEKVFREYNWGNHNTSVRVFPILIGREASDNRHAKWMATANRGLFTHISTLADVQENVQKYIQVLSRPLALSRTKNYVWTSLYADYVTEESEDKDKGLQYITSFAAPVYTTKDNITGLLGVAGTDVTVKQIQDLIPYNRLGPNSYAFVVTHQGYVLFHPNFKPTYQGEEEILFHPDFQNVDITEVEHAEDDNLLNEMRKKLISGKKQEYISLVTKMPYDEGENDRGEKSRRIAMRNYTFYFSKINDTNFSLGIALAQKRVPTTAYLNIEKTYLRKDSTEIAPWRYCRYSWTDVNKLYEFLKKKFSGKNGTSNANGCSDESDSFLLWDLINSNKILDWWKRMARYHKTGSEYIDKNQEDIYVKNGIDQVFFWSSAGMTKYVKATSNISEPNFIKDNIKTIQNKHFRQTAEGREHGYMYTYSVPFSTEIVDPKSMAVTITATIHPRKVIVGVVGLQLKYQRFVQNMEDAITTMSVPKTKTSQEHPSCLDTSVIECYILDNNGYILYANIDKEANGSTVVGKLLTGPRVHEPYPVDRSLMGELVERGFFKSENYLNRQVMCKKKIAPDGGSSASFLLNPFKQLVNLFLWLSSEMVIFLFEWSLFTEKVNTKAAKCYTRKELKGIAENDNLSELGVKDKNFLLNNYPLCDFAMEPCASFHTRYRTNFKKLRKYSDTPFKDTLSECAYCEDPLMCTADCKRSYTVQWINNTNMMFVSIAAFTQDCWCTFNRPTPVHDEEKTYNSSEKCQMLLHKTSRTKTRKGCTDHHPGEPYPDTSSRQEKISFSYIVLAVTVMLCVLTNQKCV